MTASLCASLLKQQPPSPSRSEPRHQPRTLAKVQDMLDADMITDQRAISRTICATDNDVLVAKAQMPGRDRSSISANADVQQTSCFDRSPSSAEVWHHSPVKHRAGELRLPATSSRASCWEIFPRCMCARMLMNKSDGVAPISTLLLTEERMSKKFKVQFSSASSYVIQSPLLPAPATSAVTPVCCRSLQTQPPKTRPLLTSGSRWMFSCEEEVNAAWFFLAYWQP